MKKEINPVVAVVIAILVVAALGYVLYSRTLGAEPQYGAEMPEVVRKEFEEKGPRPMPPIPMPGGGSVAPGGGATGAPVTPDGSG